MKSITPAMAAHLKQTTTTLTTLWKIKRTDGQIFGFTELDRDVTYLGQLYKSTGGFNKSAMSSSATMSVDNLEVNGFLSDDTIPDTELRNGAFDFAEVEIFMVNYMDLSMGTIKLRYGYFAEVRSAPSGAFLVELRGLVQMLGQKVGELYTPECRADLGDSRCKVSVLPPERASNRSYYIGEKVLAYTEASGRIPQIGVPFNNLRFDREDGWGEAFYTNIVAQDGVAIKPRTGPFFALFEADGDLFGAMQQQRSLLTGPITQAMINTGELKIRFKGYFMSIQPSMTPYMSIRFSGPNGINSTWESTSVFDVASPQGTWKEYTADIPIPAGMNTALIKFRVGSRPDYGYPRMGMDDLSFDYIIPETVADFRMFGGVEFEATVDGGISAATLPQFNTEIGALTTDGTQIWKTVAPTHTFLDTVAEDAVDSSTLVLSSIDQPDDWFAWGVLKILTGDNAGIAVEPISWNNETKVLKLAMPLPHKTLAGTYIQIQTGCDRGRKTCRVKFDNLLNFRGEPDIPGTGQYFKVAGL